MMDVLIEVQSATVRYGDMVALDRVGLCVGRGERIGLVGASGSGKSTLLNVMAGLCAPDDGAVVWHEPIRSQGYRSLALVVQHPSEIFSPREKIGDFLREPLRNFQLARAAQADALIREMLAQVHLPETVLRRYPHELSGGQLQRVVIARALSLHPACILFDEPTSALDVLTQAATIDLIAELQRLHGFASVFVSHDLGVVQQMADRVAVMSHGQLVEVLPSAAAGAAVHPETQKLLAAERLAEAGADLLATDVMSLIRTADGRVEPRPRQEVLTDFPTLCYDTYGDGHRVLVRTV